MELWHRQVEMLEAIRDQDRVAVRAGRKVSKSTTAVVAALWWAVTRKGKVFMTSMTHSQIKDILWSELRTIVEKSEFSFRNIPLDPKTGFRPRHGGSIVGRTADNRENMQGYSGADTLYLVDEASGMDRTIFEAIDGNTAGGGKIVLMGNPTRTAGIYYDAFHRNRKEWHGIRISSRESPNVVEDRIVIPGLAVKSWVDKQDEKFGKDDPYVRVHVDGEFPGSGTNTVINLAMSEAAQERWAGTPAVGRLELGVDVARMGGDESVVYPRRGLKAFKPIAERSTDTFDVVNMVLRAIELHGHAGERPLVKVDVIGIGAGVYDVLNKQHRDKLDAAPINVAEAPTAEPDPDEGIPGYAQLRDQIWFALRDWIKAGGSFPPDEDTHGDVIAPVYKFNARGRYKVSSKDEIRELISRSPDRADALGLSVYTPPPPLITSEHVAESLYR